MSMTAEDFSARLAQLSAAFAKRCLSEADQLDQLATELEAHNSDETNEAIRTIAHRLVGGAAPFGLAELGDPAANLEDLVAEGAATGVVAETARDLANLIRNVAA